MSSSPTVILITGANSGVGLATAEVISAASPEYHVIIASRNASNGENALEEIRAQGNAKGTLSTVQLDVTDQISVEKAQAKIAQDFGRLDILVNNAGIDDKGSTAESYLKRLEDDFSVNVIGSARVTEVFRPLLRESPDPRLIFVSSGLGSVSAAADANNPMRSTAFQSYRVSKAGLNMLFTQERKANEQTGIKTYDVCPGLVRSNLRGKSEAQISAGGRAGDPLESGQLILDVIEGRRDADAGKFIKKDGTWDW